MFWALPCPSSGARDYSAEYHMGCRLSLQPGHLTSPSAPNFQPPATREPDGPCGNQHYSCELLMMGMAVPETC